MSTLAFIGQPEFLIVVALALLLFGYKNIPKLFRDLGRAKGELQKGLAEGHEDASSGDDDEAS